MMAVLAVALIGRPTDACPFCGVVAEPLASRRDAAACVAVGEPAGPASISAEGLAERGFRVLAVLRGEGIDVGDVANARTESASEGTAILFGRRTSADAALSWSAIAADESLIAHVATAPASDRPAPERLRWFAARLDHPDPRVADDAFAEFGIAPYEAVREACDAFDGMALCERVADSLGDQRTRGFFGLALGLVASRSRDRSEREAARAALHAAVEAPADDFRAGYDGLLAGLLVADGEAGLDRIEALGLLGGPTSDRPEPRPVDQRHLLAALRFAWESLPETVPRSRIAVATRRLLASPVVAAEAVVDLARYADWSAVDVVADLWESCGRDDPVVRRAVAGYLSACPTPRAGRRLEMILKNHPAEGRAALDAASLPLGR